jgi:hypothetical protein
LDDRAHEAIVVGHLEESKGWLFYVPVADEFVESSMARFVTAYLPSNRRHHPTSHALQDSSASQPSSTKTDHHLHPTATNAIG